MQTAAFAPTQRISLTAIRLPALLAQVIPTTVDSKGDLP